ncbi:MAG: T9SS type A sorting domain-containing protein [Crocinitomix sp.]|nr:T9SS type A sorting domain-containing protein [Crocinitomix sp.]
MKPKLLLIAWIVIAPFNMEAQEVVTSTGDFFESTDVQVSWTIGELMTATFETASVHLTQGEQQSSFNYSSIVESKDMTDVSIYPNPFQDVFTVNSNGEQYQFAIYAATGQTVLAGEIGSAQTQLTLSEIADGIYYLRIYSDSSEKSFKLIKH